MRFPRRSEECPALRLYKAEQSGELLGKGSQKSGGEDKQAAGTEQKRERTYSEAVRRFQTEGEAGATGAESCGSKNGRKGR